MNEDRTASVRARDAAPRRKRFSIEQANRTLPLVRRIITDIVAQHRLVERIQKRRRTLLRQGRSDAGKAAEAQGVDAARRLAELVNEVTSIGCEIRDYERGCVDFPALHGGREVFLCWVLGEENIQFWHETHAGEGARQRIAAERKST